MKFFATTITTLAASGLVLADLSSVSCGVSHNSGNGGNQFSITWTGLPGDAEPTICGTFAKQVSSDASGANVQLKGGVTCRTDGAGQPGMFTQLTLNKQSCQVQLALINTAMSEAIGALSGGTNVDAATCDLSNC